MVGTIVWWCAGAALAATFLVPFIPNRTRNREDTHTHDQSLCPAGPGRAPGAGRQPVRGERLDAVPVIPGRG